MSSGKSDDDDERVVVKCHPLTKDPDTAWSEMSCKVQSVDPLPIDTPIREDSLRFVCISDTHARTSRMENVIPDGDVLLHAGDFTNFGDYNEVRQFNDFLGTLPHRYKVVIAGNHEISFDRDAAERFGICRKPGSKENRPGNYRDPRKLLTNCIYLEDSSTDVHGIIIYGSPWTPIYMNWAFSLPRGEACLKKWNVIPENVDVLLTHGPPLGYGDYTITSVRAGCVELLLSVQKRIKPKYHVFGHIHEGYGVRSDGMTTYVNCSICDVDYKAIHPPIIFDLPLKNGSKKS